MPLIEVDTATAVAIGQAALAANVSEGEVVRRLAQTLPREQPTGAATRIDRVKIHMDYDGHRVQALFDARSHGVEIVGEPFTGGVYGSPSGAATAVVGHYRSGVSPNRNGWTVWIVTATGRTLDSIRRPGST